MTSQNKKKQAEKNKILNGSIQLKQECILQRAILDTAFEVYGDSPLLREKTNKLLASEMLADRGIEFGSRSEGDSNGKTRENG